MTVTSLGKQSEFKRRAAESLAPFEDVRNKNMTTQKAHRLKDLIVQRLSPSESSKDQATAPHKTLRSNGAGGEAENYEDLEQLMNTGLKE